MNPEIRVITTEGEMQLLQNTKKRRQVSNQLQREVFARDGLQCRYCGTTGDVSIFQIDHVKPVKFGGTDIVSNLVVSCRSCNMAKGTSCWTPRPWTASAMSEKASKGIRLGNRARYRNKKKKNPFDSTGKYLVKK